MGASIRTASPNAGANRIRSGQNAEPSAMHMTASTLHPAETAMTERVSALLRYLFMFILPHGMISNSPNPLVILVIM